MMMEFLLIVNNVIINVYLAFNRVIIALSVEEIEGLELVLQELLHAVVKQVYIKIFSYLF